MGLKNFNLEKYALKYSRFQASHPFGFLLVAGLCTVIAAFLASGLKFDSSYEALLPQGAPQVKNADNIRERTGGTRQIVIAIGGDDHDARVKFGHELKTKLETLKRVRAVDFEFPVNFFKDRGLWLMDKDRLDRLVPAVKEAVRIAKWQANPLHLHLDEEAEKAELDDAWKKVDNIIGEKKVDLPFDKYLDSRDGKYTFMLIVPSIKFSDIEQGRSFLDEVHKAIDELDPKSFGVTARTAGNLDMLQEQHVTMSTDLRNASIIALVLGILIVASVTRRPSSPFIIGVPLVAGVIWTFALARIFIGHVNIVTGFLVAVLIGLGIDFGVHILVRFLQELQLEGSSRKEAVVRSVSGTLSPAMTSAFTTAGTFLSFIIADFRGFSEFGVIAGVGVLLTFVASFTTIPPLLLLFKRPAAKALTSKTQSLLIQEEKAVPRRLAWLCIFAVIAVALYGAIHINDIPFRNNFRLLRGHSPATEFLDYVDENLGIGFNPAVVLTSSLKDAMLVAQKAREQEKSLLARGETSHIGRVFALTDILPDEPSKRRGAIQSLREILNDPALDKVENKGGNRAQDLARARRMVAISPWGEKAIPEMLRRRFKTLDGSQYIVFIWPKEVNLADYQAAAWEDELDQLKRELEQNKVSVDLADETLIVAWIYRLILADGPPLLLVASIIVFLFLLLDFRNLRQTLLVAFPLALGMLVFVGAVFARSMELNMFNIIVVPSIIGIGIDNAVHIFHRYRALGPGSVPLLLRTTGIATLLASLTTAIGFGSSLVSHHLGLKSMGELAIIGISSTFIAATVFFPCLLMLIEKKYHK